MEFRSIVSELRDITPYLFAARKHMCEYTPLTFATWMREFQAEVCLEDEVCYIRNHDIHGRMNYWYPMRKDGMGTQTDVMRLYEYVAGECGDDRLSFCFLNEEECNLLKEWFHGYSKKYDEAFSDYLYLADEMREFPGRKFAKKRNHLHQYERAYGVPEFHEITVENLLTVKEFYERFSSGEPMDGFREMEHRSVLDTLNQYFAYALVGGYLTVEGKVIGFSIGEYKNDTLYVHIEKADTSYVGAYATLVKMFAEHFATEVTYMNREEDMGEEGLRRSKSSYYPYALVHKYTVTVTK